MNPRTAQVTHQTSETNIVCQVVLDGTGRTDIHTGIGFLDHLLTGLGRHSHIDITLHCQGDLHIDDHHTAEDCALSLGSAIDQALGDRRGIKRFGSAYAPLDEALARAVLDLSGRPGPYITLGLVRPNIGPIACENITHVLQSLAIAGRATLHVDVLSGANDHHRAEAAFKATALALRQAVSLDRGGDGVPSTKGVL